MKSASRLPTMSLAEFDRPVTFASGRARLLTSLLPIGSGIKSENNRNRFCRFLCVGRGIGSDGDEDIDTGCHEFGGHASKLSRLLIGKTVFQHDGFAVDVTDIREALYHRLIIGSLLLGVRGMPKYSIRGTFAGCCALAANAQVAAPPKSVMNSRRCMSGPQAQETAS